MERVVDVVDPIDVARVGIPTVRHRPHAAASQTTLPAMRAQTHQRFTEAMRAKRTGDEMRMHGRQRRELGCDPMADDVNLMARSAVRSGAPREIAGERVVGHVHAAVRGEVTGDQKPHAHLTARGRVSGIVATACTAPARNQNCRPICVTNGVKLKISAAVPRLAASAIAAHARTLASTS